MANHPLEHHDLDRLEQAAKELKAHIRDRKNRRRPSMTRRVIGLFFSVPMIAIGLAAALNYFGVTSTPIGKPAVLGGFWASVGALWIYYDWFG